MSDLAQVTLPQEQLALAKRLAGEAGYESVDEYLSTLIDEQQARMEWKTLGDEQQQAIQAKIDQGWDQARRGQVVDAAELRQALRRKSESRRAGRG